MLIVDNDPSIRDTLGVILRGHGHRILEAEDGLGALDTVRRHRVDVVFLDVDLVGEPGGFAVLEQLRLRFPDVEVVMCGVDRAVETAVRAIKLGAFDFLAKDFGNLARAADLVQRALVKQGHREVIPSSDATRVLDVGLVVGQSKRMRELVEVVSKIAPAPATVLVHGESGTGKELLAKLIHRWSDRAERPYVAVNLAAIPSELAESLLFGHERGAFTGAHRSSTGKFEQADGGTLFLDEIGDLPLPLQGKLLRAIQEREIERVGGEHAIPVDVRLIAATHVDLLSAVQDGRFRDDLYYRLNVIPLTVPPLRERREEIPELARFFARKFAARARREMPDFSDQAMERLIAYEWPGNVRELENVIERLITVCDRPTFDEQDLPPEVRLGPDADHLVPEACDHLQTACETFERNFIARALERCGWNKAACARRLGISYATMKNKIARYSLVEPLGRGRR